MSEIIEIEHSKDKYPDPDWNQKRAKYFKASSALSDKDFSEQQNKILSMKQRVFLVNALIPRFLSPKETLG